MKFTVYIEPVSKARARTLLNKKTGRVYSFTPRKTEKAEWAIRSAYVSHDEHEIMDGLRFPKDIPLKLSVTFYVPRPKSAPKRRFLPTPKPDLRNLLGPVEDALSKYLWHDDSQITTYHEIKKRYGSPPRIEVEVTEDPATFDMEK